MGLDIVLTDFNGESLESVGDPKNFLHRLLPPGDEASESVLAKIDWYGDTYFNYIQIKWFLLAPDVRAKLRFARAAVFAYPDAK